MKPKLEELSSGTQIETRWVSKTEKIIRTSHKSGHTTYQKRVGEVLHNSEGPAYVNLTGKGPLCYYWIDGLAREGEQSVEAARHLITEFDGLPAGS